LRSASVNTAASGSTRNSSTKTSAMPISVQRTHGASVVVTRLRVRSVHVSCPRRLRCQACSALITSSSTKENSSITTATAVAPA
jgi:hypothetical protein